MDTMNIHNKNNNKRIDVSSPTATTTMGTTERQNEKASEAAAVVASDEDDFKLSIPYFDGETVGVGNCNGNEIDYARLQQHTAQQQQSSLSRTSSNYDLLQQNLDDIEDVSQQQQLNFTNWDNDDLMGSDYSGQSESPNLFSGAATPASYYDDPNAPPDIKYSPHELLIQPPARYHSKMQFEMQPPTQHHQSQQQQLNQRRHLQPLPAPPPHLQQHLHPALQPRHHHQYQHHQQHSHHPQYGGSSSSGVVGKNSGGTTFQYPSPHHSPHAQPTPHLHHQPHTQQTSDFHHHPNMWYPNAPYGASRYNYDPHRFAYHYNDGGGGGGYGHDPILDMLHLSNSGREARNRAEKNRRDKLNGSIQELSTMVPHVAESPRRVDKTAVLRFAAHGLRLKYVFGESLQQRTQVTDPLMKLLDSFFITLTCHGQIVLISSSIEQHLGHCQADLYGQNILHITHPEDHCIVKHQLIPTDLENLFDTQANEEGGEPRLRSKVEEEIIDKKLREDKRNFTVRLARAGPRSEPTAYEVVRIDGCFRRSDAAPRGVRNNPFPSSQQLIRRSRGRDDSIPLHSISGNDIVLIAIARIVRPPKVSNCFMESNNLEYKTRHLIDGRIIDCDQRIGIVAGYMTDEIRNLSPFTFMHQDDVRWVIVALRQMYDCNSSYGESTYRLLSRNGNFIYLQSRGYLEIDKNTNKVHSFICINSLLTEEEGKRRVQEMKRKFSIIINTQIPQSSIDAPASDHPHQLERAVLRLIQNLQKSSDDEENYEHNGERKTSSNTIRTDHKGTSHHSPNHVHSNASKQMVSGASVSSKTPPLALVPPEAASVKSSISKSVSVVNVTAARSLRGNQRLKSPLSTTEDDEDDDDDGDFDMSPPSHHKYHVSASPTNFFPPHCTCRSYNGGSDICEHCRRFNYMQQFPKESVSRKHKLSGSQSSDNGDNEVPQKRRLNEKQQTCAILTPPAQIIETKDQDIKDIIAQSIRLDSSNECSNETMEAQQIPADIFVNFKNDFETEIDGSKRNNDESTTKKNATIKES